MRVLIADKFEQSGRDGLEAIGCDYAYQPDAKDDSLVEAVAHYQPDVLVVRSTKVPEAAIAAGAALRYGFGRARLARVMAGTDNDNEWTRRVMERGGLRYARDDFNIGVPVAYYALDREDWRDEGAPHTHKE